MSEWIDVENVQCELIGVESCLSRNYCPKSDLTVLKISQIFWSYQRIIDNRKSKVCVVCKNKVFWVSRHFLSSIFAQGQLCHLGAQVSAPVSLYRLSNEFPKTATAVYFKTCFEKDQTGWNFLKRNWFTGYQKDNNFHSIVSQQILVIFRSIFFLYCTMFFTEALLGHRSFLF